MLLIVFFEFLAIMPDIGYKAKIEAYTIKGEEQSGNIVVLAKCDIAFNPFLYGLSWLAGEGWFVGNYTFTTSSVWYLIQGSTGDYYLRWRNRTPEEIKQEAISRLYLAQFNINLLFNVVIFFIIGLLKLHDIYLCIFGSVLGFLIGGPIGALLSFIATAIIVFYVKLKVWKEGLFTKMRKFFLEEELYPYETPRA